jgi:protein-S-isoprenylcysteine O-methyltransferase Ste14
MFSIRTPHTICINANVIVGGRKGLAERLLLLGMMALPLLHLATGILAFADHEPPAWATWTGARLQIPFAWLFWRSHADLGRNWSPGLELRKEHPLITAGVYHAYPPSHVRSDPDCGADPAAAGPQMDRRCAGHPRLRGHVVHPVPGGEAMMRAGVRHRLRRLLPAHRKAVAAIDSSCPKRNSRFFFRARTGTRWLGNIKLHYNKRCTPVLAQQASLVKLSAAMQR